MKIAVYSIALNERQFVDRWYESAKEADYLFIADTGSTDGTVQTARHLGIVCQVISVKPWRFDDARNAALAYLPDDIDYCISLDLDETLAPGWRQALEAATTTRPRYKYTWNFNEDGSPGLQFNGDHIHTRHGYRWKHAVHECLYPDRIQETQEILDLEIHHRPDQTKSRGQYLPLLKLSTEEEPYNDRNAFYYARELYFYNQKEDSINEFKRYLALPTATWAPERSSAMRHIGEMTDNLEEKEQWFRDAAKEAPDRREPWVKLAELFYQKGAWTACYQVAERAMEIETKPLDYQCEGWAWNELPYDYASFALFRLYHSEEMPDNKAYCLDKAIKYGAKAVELNPNDVRLRTNLQFYLKEQSGNDNL